MDASTIILAILQGLTLGMVLMLVAGGLTIIFGMLEVLNFAHGSDRLGSIVWVTK